MTVERVSITLKARQVVDKLRAKHGELMFHQSGGCCDGSAPMCFQKDEFLIKRIMNSEIGKNCISLSKKSIVFF